MANRISVQNRLGDKLYLEVEGTVQMYSGDRGTDVFPTVTLVKTELQVLINRLTHELDNWEDE